MKGYWFSNSDGTTEYQLTPIKPGDVLTCTGKLIPCHNGLHFSPTPFDAFQYALCPLMWEVEASDDAVPHGDPVDKYCASSRTHIRCVDLTPVMRQFAAKQALGVMHLWDAPMIVQEFLRDVSNGKNRDDIRDAAWDAARAAAWDAARDAAWDAARAAARDAARAAAKDQFNQLAIAALEDTK